MLVLHSLAVVASVVGLVTGQTVTGQNIDPNSVAQSTRQYWCESQTSSCPLLCLQIPGASDSPKDNTCSYKTLSYTCICSNGMSPNASQYSQTIPYFICTEQNNQCVANCKNNDADCQTSCRTKNPCGAQNPDRVNLSTSTTTASTPLATTSLPAFTGVPDEGIAARPLADMSQVYGLVVVVGTFLTGFATLL